MSERSSLDKFLMRFKDVMLLVSTSVPILLMMMKFWGLPGIVEAQAKDIDMMKEQIVIQRTEIAVMKAGFIDIKESLNRIEHKINLTS